MCEGADEMEEEEEEEEDAAAKGCDRIGCCGGLMSGLEAMGACCCWCGCCI